MAYALELAFDIPPAWGYLICALVVIPLVTHGVTAISRLQVWTQPLWLVLLVLPYVYVFNAHPSAARRTAVPTPARTAQGGGFDPLLFGAALTVGIALITQMGEQVDYLRFMPEKTRGQPLALVGRRAGGRAGLGGAGRAEDAGRRAAGLPGAAAARCRPTARSTRTRCTWRPTSTCSRTTAGRWRPRRCSWWSRSSRSTSPTPMPARWPGATSSRASRTATRAAWCGWCSTR